MTVFSPSIRSGGGNMVAIDLIVQHVHSQLEEVRTFTPTGLITFLHTSAHQKTLLNTFRIMYVLFL